MTELPPVPPDPAALKAWVESLSREELAALTTQITSGVLTRRLGLVEELGPRNREIHLAPPPSEPSLLTLTIELRGSKPTLDALEAMAGGARSIDPELLTRLARGTLFGVIRPK